ncbi:MAG: F-box protein [Alphaproteobacteria bacterium]|nr:F-box protein [Alphaproteobacteria bacterium]MBY0501885.1 F-box protein [Alphaproteobacteria bacterium]
MELKKTLLWISLYLFSFSNCQACDYEESNEERSCYRTLRNLSNVFSCFFGSCIEDSAQHHYRGISGYVEGNQIEELVSPESYPIDMLPSEMLYQVALFLSPPDIISLVKSSKKFSCLRDNNFWVNYNKEYSYSSWSRELPAIRVTFSYYWFKNGKVRKAGDMGFPRAHEFIRQQEKLKRKGSQIDRTWNHSIQMNYMSSYRYRGFHL